MKFVVHHDDVGRRAIRFAIEIVKLDRLLPSSSQCGWIRFYWGNFIVHKKMIFTSERVVID